MPAAVRQHCIRCGFYGELGESIRVALLFSRWPRYYCSDAFLCALRCL